MTPTDLHAAVDRAERLVRREASLRQAGRQLELNPSCLEEAAGLFRIADEVRRERMELVGRTGIAS